MNIVERMTRFPWAEIVRTWDSGRKSVVLLTFALGGILLAGCQRSVALEVDPPRRAPKITGVDWNDEPFSLEGLRGSVVVVSFGYTNCPDVCPTTLSRLRKAVAGIEGVEVVFFTVDPERDTKERLASYIPAFAADFHAPTLEPAVFAKMRKAFDVVATRHYAAPGTRNHTARYMIDHTSGVFLIDPEGMVRVRIPAEATPEQLRAEIQRLAKGARA